MPQHDVEVSIPTTKTVLHADVVFEVRGDDAKIGELHVSKGTVDWRPAHSKSRIQLTWEQFDQLMQSQRQ